jgi:hypothetical protein
MPAGIPSLAPHRSPINSTGIMLAAVTEPPWGMCQILIMLSTADKAINAPASIYARSGRRPILHPSVTNDI